MSAFEQVYLSRKKLPFFRRLHNQVKVAKWANSKESLPLQTKLKSFSNTEMSQNQTLQVGYAIEMEPLYTRLKRSEKLE